MENKKNQDEIWNYLHLLSESYLMYVGFRNEFTKLCKVPKWEKQLFLKLKCSWKLHCNFFITHYPLVISLLHTIYIYLLQCICHCQLYSCSLCWNWSSATLENLTPFHPASNLIFPKSQKPHSSKILIWYLLAKST